MIDRLPKLQIEGLSNKSVRFPPIEMKNAQAGLMKTELNSLLQGMKKFCTVFRTLGIQVANISWHR